MAKKCYKPWIKVNRQKWSRTLRKNCTANSQNATPPQKCRFLLSSLHGLTLKCSSRGVVVDFEPSLSSVNSANAGLGNVRVWLAGYANRWARQAAGGRTPGRGGLLASFVVFYPSQLLFLLTLFFPSDTRA